MVNLKNFDLPNQLLVMEVAIITKPQNYGINQSQNIQLMLKICGFIAFRKKSIDRNSIKATKLCSKYFVEGNYL